jgi:hypothetical protein
MKADPYLGQKDIIKNAWFDGQVVTFAVRLAKLQTLNSVPKVTIISVKVC